ncbi:response regulator [Scytonema sp. UIC 10036]|uniref:response regulator n=1 Tax=Scytonema sp. UIC 10036 TaxID=2304196 RepID=UPI0012DAA629|nr:response regulator [Scytonema sp. UIC 10036]MUG99883.1 response regulator [Scytonema sp. UIC 10036]
MPDKRILIIDNEKRLSAVVQACLENLGGWEAFSANSVKEGLLKAKSEQPDAILLDVMMPGEGGLALIEKLRSYPTTQSIPVILLTAKADTVDPEEFSKLGISGVIAKPFDPMQLAQQVAAFLGW